MFGLFFYSVFNVPSANMGVGGDYEQLGSQPPEVDS